MMKQIGILTFHETNNFGAILQAVALYKAIENIENCEIINYHCEELIRREKPRLRYCNTYRAKIIHLIVGGKRKIKFSNLQIFLKSEASVSETEYDRRNVHLLLNKYDKIFLGSDMLWCKRYTGGDPTYFLDFCEKSDKKYAFSTSGSDEWTEGEEKIIESELKTFSKIAVRENSLSIKLTKMLNRKVEWVCDPTMLLEVKYWNQFTKPIRKNYCLIYMDTVDHKCRKDGENWSKRRGYNFCVMTSEIRNLLDRNIVSPVTISSFLSYIKSAKILFTASYHGMLFAIFFHVPFVYYEQSPGRLESIAQRFNLSGRNGMRYSFENMSEIDWVNVDAERERFRGSSLEVLREYVEK